VDVLVAVDVAEFPPKGLLIVRARGREVELLAVDAGCPEKLGDDAP
jgi:hypothetical protein